MIGVIANPSEHAVVREFFELFKTPWEFYRPDRRYEVLLCAGEGDFPGSAARLIVVYASHEVPFDVAANIQCFPLERNACPLAYKGTRIPIYGESSVFQEKGPGNVDTVACEPVLSLHNTGAARITRIGYDLFHEVRVLLTAGQPAANAGIPTLELHIALLRDLIVSSGIPLVEIPPVPEGYRFIACLTHDVDHPSLRRHRFDHTMFGFLYRSTVGSLIDALRGRASLRNLLANWSAAFKLPFVHLGLAKDFWLEFGGYTILEGGLPSSFFVIPFKGSPGRMGPVQAPSRRASGYGASDISAQIHELMSAGCEIGLHGIDAWLDSSSGSNELEQIRQITGMHEIGVRMHWLYFDEQSPVALEQAGADYDSTVGYNQTVGYRAGTTQAYKFLGASRLLELPMHVMDTALFFPCYLGLSPSKAKEQVGTIIDNAVRFGGNVTVNWHDRSIAPERMWGDIYADLVGELKRKGAWFASAAQGVAWFRKRRSVVLEGGYRESSLQAGITVGTGKELPALLLRTHHGASPCQDVAIAEADSDNSAACKVKHAMYISVASS
jgi:hypothetical protein